MAGVIADTHALIWYWLDSPRLSDSASAQFEACRTGGVRVGIASISIVEIVYLVDKGRIPAETVPLLQESLERQPSLLEIVPLTQSIAMAVRQVRGLVSFSLNVQRSTFNVSPLIVLSLILLLVVWTIAHLWTMTWAYHPPLPVSTRPEAKAQAGQPVNHAFNQFVTLVGYNSQLDLQKHLLRLDLIWQAEAVSPVDYLTEVTLSDAAGEVQAQWVGHPANGRYPTRAWDLGDIVRDTAWLPLPGLKPGNYQLTVNLVPTSRAYPPRAAASPLELPRRRCRPGACGAERSGPGVGA